MFKIKLFEKIKEVPIKYLETARTISYGLVAMTVFCIFFPFSQSHAEPDSNYSDSNSTTEILSTVETKDSVEGLPLVEPIEDSPVVEAALLSPAPVSNETIPEENALMYEPPVLPSTYEDMLTLDLTQPSTIPVEFWEYWLPNAYKPIAEELPLFDEEGINAAWVVSVIIAECGWDANVVGSYNYFNFTVDTLSYTDFNSPVGAMQYARSWFKQSFFNPEWHKTRPAGYCQWNEGDPLTIERVNEHYAINPDGSVNWNWTKVACEIMVKIYSDYSVWREN